MDDEARVQRSPQLRSRITNGTTVLIGVDMRSAWGRRFRDLLDAHADDLGGADQLSEAQRSIIRRAATLEIELERLEASFATSEWDRPDGRPSAARLEMYSRLSGQLRRLLDSLGASAGQRPPPPAPTPGALERMLGPDDDDGDDDDGED